MCDSEFACFQKKSNKGENVRNLSAYTYMFLWSETLLPEDHVKYLLKKVGFKIFFYKIQLIGLFQLTK